MILIMGSTVTIKRCTWSACSDPLEIKAGPDCAKKYFTTTSLNKRQAVSKDSFCCQILTLPSACPVLVIQYPLCPVLGRQERSSAVISHMLQGSMCCVFWDAFSLNTKNSVKSHYLSYSQLFIIISNQSSCYPPSLSSTQYFCHGSSALWSVFLFLHHSVQTIPTVVYEKARRSAAS